MLAGAAATSGNGRANATVPWRKDFSGLEGGDVNEIPSPRGLSHVETWSTAQQSRFSKLMLISQLGTRHHASRTEECDGGWAFWNQCAHERAQFRDGRRTLCVAVASNDWTRSGAGG